MVSEIRALEEAKLGELFDRRRNKAEDKIILSLSLAGLEQEQDARGQQLSRGFCRTEPNGKPAGVANRRSLAESNQCKEVKDDCHSNWSGARISSSQERSKEPREVQQQRRWQRQRRKGTIWDPFTPQNHRRRWTTMQCIITSTKPLNGSDLRRASLIILFALLLCGLVCGSLAGRKLVTGERKARQTQQQQQIPATVPYKTFYVTRACEWKSNLFVPKSNDIHFAQSNAGNSNHQEQPQVNPLDESSVVYETTMNFQQPGMSSSGNGREHQLQQDELNSRTMLSTESKALILALPISMSHSFAGYEPACSIRLIVPKNLRILAKLTSRRLTFAQQQLLGSEPATNLANNNNENGANEQETQSLWLNVSQNQFIETEHRTIETEGNVLAFRFLLERFANKQVPDTRFQVVLTAFQTLSENSDSSGVAQSQLDQPTFKQQHPTFKQRPAHPNGATISTISSPNAQFICDQQRLISAELACDGFKNCNDGQDEELANCLALRSQQTPELNTGGSHSGVFPFGQFGGAGNQIGTGNSRNQTAPSNDQSGQQLDQQQRPSWLLRFWHYARDSSSLTGFLLGLLLVLAMLACCSCLAYLCLLAWRRLLAGQSDVRPLPAGRSVGAKQQPAIGRLRRGLRQQRQRADEQGDHETDSLAASQNLENVARLKRVMLADSESGLMDSKRQQPPPRLQSILKRPSAQPRLRPAEPPPAVPERPARGQSQPHQQQQRTIPVRPEDSGAAPAKRGALSSSLSEQPGGKMIGEFRPTPSRRLTRPSRPAPIPSGDSQHRGATSSTITTSVTGTQQRVTTYHYSAGSTHLSEAYLQRLIAEQEDQHQQRPPTPPGGAKPNYKRRQPDKGPDSPAQSSLI